MHHEVFPGSASCKCYFFDNLGKLSPTEISGEGFDGRFKDVLRRRFLRQVRLKERRKRRNDGSTQRLFLSGITNVNILGLLPLNFLFY
ncbi:putative protein MULTIPOLAR SPINDLE 1 [Helianthus annuus]|uniref:Uncharacterized protein n=1 Tax=Helianthus annuus TaxID=4232 RepID=A0A9K3DU13_HELAN|nr:putative protein MULTIPOLAR SPINDLE 1 [Helianthus annuus]KAJ0438904.1 putative protein MULTIPOLAR SPINDLE 1 [Helianthus annuus]KAJ0443842.1 putative protein MULTIPOLAR SPINDLE 1 [Helianthus annuus]KAJ0461257.1 putative protein MULTIPOLAR SPINDLE 1 [Helianthus annuus]KAJ0641692.1 putative protein MULTIPOLAR SPINDLE 1 [Helianthus annuus]